jgi:hypothetical protein
MWYKFTAEPGFLKAELYDRETAEQTREFLAATEAEFFRGNYSQVLICVHSSNALFAIDKYGASAYFERAAAIPHLKVAAVGDTEEQRLAHKYIETLAQSRGVNLRAFADEESAARWLREPAAH